MQKKGWRPSFGVRLTIAFILAIAATTLAAGVPAYWFVSSRLEAQSVERLEAGNHVTLAILQSQLDEQTYLTRLISQRPTLQRLWMEHDLPGLDSYLRAILASTELDHLVILDSSGGRLAGSTWVLPAPEFDPASPNVVNLAAGTLNAALIVIEPLFDPATESASGYVLTGRDLNQAYCAELAQVTGFGISIISAGGRLASSFAGAATLAAVEGLVGEDANHDPPVILTDQGTGRYYATYSALPYASDIGLSVEIALPIDGMLEARSRAALALILSTAIVAALAGILAARYARQVTNPLRALTLAAEKIGHGDLSTPVPFPAAEDEIATLAQAFEQSRLKTRDVMEELAQAMAWSETVFESIHEGIITVDRDSLITSFNQGAERILGVARTGAIGKPLAQVLSNPDEDIGERIRANPSGSLQVTVMTPSGLTTTLSITSTSFTAPGRGTSETALVLRDTTEHEALQEMRSHFLANISHEFRTPLAALNAAVELMLSESEPLTGEEIRKLLGSIHMSVAGLQTLIDNLLESASIEAGRFAIHRQVMDMVEVLQQAAGMLQPLLGRRSQQLNIQRQPESAVIYADPTRVTQVLVNLISNASKYSPIGEPIDVTISFDKKRWMKLCIADRGPGLAPAERTTLFRRFVRLQSDPGAQYGIGLGLHVAKAIVEEHGGQIGVDSRPGGGSIFWFSLPGRIEMDYESTDH